MIFMRVEWSGEVGSGVGKWDPPWVPQGIHPGGGTPRGGAPQGPPLVVGSGSGLGTPQGIPPRGGTPWGSASLKQSIEKSIEKWTDLSPGALGIQIQGFYQELNIDTD